MEAANERKHARLDASKTVENPPGIFRTTLCYEKNTMLCHFRMQEGAEIPLHSHEAVQTGFVIKGRIEFILGEGKSFIAETGSSYLFSSEEPHGARILEDSELIETFVPMRPEYA
jgi:quercetin dioxygenase-like cupin family protein